MTTLKLCFCVFSFERANASCKWLKDNINNSDATWYVEITKSDCGEGCGFSEYIDYNSEKSQNYSSSSGNSFIGGTCDEDEGVCSCDSTQLTGSCRGNTTSCPGLQGPYCDFNTTGRFANNESSRTFSTTSGSCIFFHCSRHGTCDIDIKSCTCDDGYGGSDCSIEYPIFRYDVEFELIFSALFLVIIVLYTVSIVWVRLHLKYRVKKICFFNLRLFFGLLFFLFAF